MRATTRSETLSYSTYTVAAQTILIDSLTLYILVGVVDHVKDSPGEILGGWCLLDINFMKRSLRF